MGLLSAPQGILQPKGTGEQQHTQVISPTGTDVDPGFLIPIPWGFWGWGPNAWDEGEQR